MYIIHLKLYSPYLLCNWTDALCPQQQQKLIIDEHNFTAAVHFIDAHRSHSIPLRPFWNVVQTLSTFTWTWIIAAEGRLALKLKLLIV